MRNYWLIAESSIIAFGLPFVFFGVTELFDHNLDSLATGLVPLLFGASFVAWAVGHVAYRSRLGSQVGALLSE
jgi:hypothetical protein